VQTLAEKLGANPVPLQLPIGAEDSFKGVVDLLENKALVWLDEGKGEKFNTIEVPVEMQDEVEKLRKEIVEKIVELDDVLLEKYL
jgi:elongation factor G